MITLRAATLDDVARLRTWDTEPHVIAATGDDDIIDWENELACAIDFEGPQWKWDFIAELDGRPIGVVQVIDPLLEESHYWGEVAANLRAIDIWIGPADALGRGYGTTMMELALDFCYADPSVTAVLIDPLASNTRARKFYERIGFEFVEYRTFGTDDCAVYQHRR